MRSLKTLMKNSIHLETLRYSDITHDWWAQVLGNLGTVTTYMAKDVTSPSFIPSLLVFVKEAKMALSRLQASLIAHQKCVKQWSSKNRMEQEQRGTDWVCWKEGIGGREEPGSCWNRQKSPSLGPLAHTNPLPSVSLPPRPTYPTTTTCLWWWW